MKKVFVVFGLIFAMAALPLRAQIYQMYSEDFEDATNRHYTLSTGSTYSMDGELHTDGAQSIKLVQRTGATVELITDTIDFSQNMALTYIVLEFDHICNLSLRANLEDRNRVATVYMKRPDQTNWTILNYQYYQGSVLSGGTYSFSCDSYGDWKSSEMVNDYWRHERFEINTVLNSVSQANRKLQFKFVVNKRLEGTADGTGWWIDAISVKASQDPIKAPVINMLSFPDAGIYPNSRGAKVLAKLESSVASPLNPDSLYVSYSVGTNPTHEDTVRLDSVAGSQGLYSAVIPFHGYDTLMRFHLVARDASRNENMATYPASETGRVEFRYARGKANKSYVGDENNRLDLSAIGSSITYPFPFYGDNRSEFVYSKAFMQEHGFGPGSLTSLTFKLSDVLAQDQTRYNFTVRMKNKPATYTNINSDRMYTADASDVYSGDWFCPAGAQYSEKTIQFTDTFAYAGEDLVVQMLYNDEVGSNYSAPIGVVTIPITPDKVTIYYLGKQAGQFDDPYTSTGFLQATSLDEWKPFFGFESQANLPLYCDAGIDSIVYPNFDVATTTAPDEQIVVRLRNFGVRTLTKARIAFDVDGTGTQYYDWTGSLDANETELVTITNTLHTEEGFHSLIAWTEDTIECGSSRIRDYEPYNDTATTDFISCAGPMSGEITIGYPNADYDNIEHFLFVLARCGVDSILNVYLAPGEYTSFAMPYVNGLSPENYVNFRAKEGGVTFYNSYGDEYLVDLSKARHVYFTGIDFATREEVPTITVDGHVYASEPLKGLLYFEPTATDCHFVTCQFTDNQAAQMATLVNTGGADSIVFDSCTFTRGQVQLWLAGEATDMRALHNQVTNCLFDNPAFAALTVTAQTSPIISHNVIADAQTNDRYLLSLQYCDGGPVVESNSIFITRGAGALAASDIEGTEDHPGVIANNMIEIKDDGSAISQMTPLNILNTNWIDVVYNSVKLSAPTRVNVPAAVIGATGSELANTRVLNNMFVVFDPNNFALSFAPLNATTVTFGHNIYFASGNTLCRYNDINNCATLSQWQSRVPSDTASFVFKPDFLNAYNADLRTYNRAIKGVGLPVASVTTDMFGTPRNPDTSCIGAFEFTTLQYDFVISSLYEPLTNYCAVPDQVEFIPSLRNIGVYVYDPDTSGADIKVYFKLNNGPTKTALVDATVGAEDSIAFSTGIMLYLPPAGQLDSVHHIKVWVESSLDPNHTNDTSEFTIVSRYHASAPTGYVTSVNYGDSIQLTANRGILQWPRHVYNIGDKANSEVYWFASPDDEEPIAVGSTYQTPPLRDATTYYVEQRRAIPLMRITQVQIRKANVVGLPATVPAYYSSNTQTAVMLTNVGSAPANMYGDQLKTFSATETYNNKEFNFPNITVEPGQSIVVQWAKTSRNDHPSALIAGDANEVPQMPIKTDVAFLYYHDGLIDDVVPLNNITSNSRWANLNVPNHIWAGAGIAMPATAPAGVIRTSWPDPNATPANSARHWIMASNDHRLTPGVSDTNLFLYSENGCRGDLGEIQVDVINVPLADIELYDLDINSGCGLGEEPITVKINNYGLEHSDSVFVHYSTGNESYVDTIADGIAVHDEHIHTFSHLLNMKRDDDTTFNITVWVDSVRGDLVRHNDILNISVESRFTLPAPEVEQNVIADYAQHLTLSLPENETSMPIWYNKRMDRLSTGFSFTSDYLYIDDTFFVSQQNLQLYKGQIGDSIQVTANREPRYPNPWQSYNLQSKGQYIITAKELYDMGLQPGLISSISYYLDEIRSNKINTFKQFAISLGTTTDTVFSSTTDWKQVEDYYIDSNYSVTTYDGNTDGLPNSHGWITYEFSEPFEWDGESSIVIQDWHICESRNTSGVSMAYISSPVSRSLYATSTSGTNSIYASAAAGTLSTYRPSMRFVMKAYSCESEPSRIDVTLTGVPDIDAMVSWTTETRPIEISSCSNSTLDVNVRNLGRQSITGYELHYSVDGGEYETNTVTGINLASSEIATVPLISTPLLPGRHSVRAYLVVEGDTINTNDTIEATLNVSFCSGSYTIGVNEQFATFNQAIDTLNLVGISGPVNFNVMPGTYHEHIVIDNISGNATNAISFTALGEVLVSQTTTPDENYILYINNSNKITFTGITFRSIAQGNTKENLSYVNSVVIENSDSVTLNECNIKVGKGDLNSAGDFAPRSTASAVVLRSNVVDFTLENSTVDSGYFAITTADSAIGIRNIVITNNQITNFLKAGLVLNDVYNLTIAGNSVSSSSRASGRPLTGITLTSIAGKVDVNTTHVYLDDSWQSTKIGLRLSQISGTMQEPVSIINNMVGITTRGTGSKPTAAAMYVDSTSYVNIYYNTFNINGMGQSLPTTHALFVGKNSSQVKVMNNILSNYAQGYAYDVEKDTSISTSNYNAFYSTAEEESNKLVYYGKAVPTETLLATLQERHGTEALSVVERPYYAGDDDLHLTVTNMTGRALYNSEVPRDIDGSIRPTLRKPSVGAHEMLPATHDISIVEITNPQWPKTVTNPIDIEGDTITVNVSFYNNGSATERNVVWSAEVVGTDIFSSPQVIANFLPQTFVEGSVQLICPVGVLDTQYVRVSIMTSGDEVPENNTRDVRFYLAPAFNITTIGTIVPEVYRNCYRDSNPVKMVVTNVGYRDIPAGTTTTIGYQTKMHTVGVEVPNIPAVATESYRFSSMFSIGDTDTITLVHTANLYPTGLVGPNARAIQVGVRTWMTYVGDKHPENDTSAYTTVTSDYKPTKPEGKDTSFYYGTWGKVRAVQIENLGVRWYYAPDTTTKPFYQNPVVTSSWLWSNTPQYFSDSTYYLQCTNTTTRCVSDFGSVNVQVKPRVEKDIAIEEIITPNSPHVYTENDTVRVRIANYGTTAQSNIPITYVLMNRNGTNANNPYQKVKETYTGTIAPGDTAIYVFKELANLAAAVSSTPSRETWFSINAYTELPGDMVRRNDTVRTYKQFNTYPEDKYCTPSMTEPSEMNITRISFGSLDLNLPPLYRTYTDRTAKYSATGNYVIPPIHVTRGMTDSIIVGVASNITPSNVRTQVKIAVFVDWDRDGEFNFEIDTNNNYVPGRYSDVAAWGKATSIRRNFASTITVPDHASYGLTRMRVVMVTDTSVTISPCYYKRTIRNTAIGIDTTITSYTNNAHIIDLMVFVDDDKTQPGVDVAVNRMVSPYSSMITDSIISPKISISNNGALPLDSVRFECNYVYADTNVADTTIYYTWTGSLRPGGSTTCTLPQHEFPTGLTTLTINALANGDADTTNNVMWHEFYRSPILVLAYDDNFDDENLWYAPRGHSRFDTNFWQLGTPHKARIDSAYSAPNAWSTMLTTTITTGYWGSRSYLYSPVFDISQVRADSIFFKLRRNMSEGSRMYMEFWNFDGYWSKVDADSLEHWYNNIPDPLDAAPQYYFDGTNADYEQCYFSTSSTGLSGDFPEFSQFRMVYETDEGNSQVTNYLDGVAFDDFAIGHARRPVDVGVVAITYPTEPKYGQIIRPEVIVHNYGNDTIRSFSLAYKPFGTNLSKMGTYTGILPPDGEDLFKFDASFIVTSQFPDTFAICAYTNVNTDIYWENDSVCSYFILAPLEHDLQMEEFVEPNSRTIAGDSVDVTIRMYNFGLDSIYLTDVVYEFNGQPPVRETVNLMTLLGRPLRYQEYFNYTFRHKVRTSLGIMSIKAYSAYSMDDYPFNDTIETSFSGVTSINDLKAQSIVLDTMRSDGFTVSLIVENDGARGANDFEVGLFFGDDTANAVIERYVNDVPIPALGTGYHMFNRVFTNREDMRNITAFVHVDGDNNPKNDTTTAIVPQYMDVAVNKVIVVENRSENDSVYIEFENRGTMVISGRRLSLSATVNGVTLHRDLEVEYMIPRRKYSILFDQTVPKDWTRSYEGTGSVVMAGDGNSANNQTTVVEVVNYKDGIPEVETNGFVLEQNYPNPFRKETRIEFAIPNAGEVTFMVLDALGHIVQQSTDNYPEGRHVIDLDMSQYASGVYYYAISYGGERQMRKMILY